MSTRHRMSPSAGTNLQSPFCVAVIWHQLVVQFRLIDGVAVMNKLRRCLKPRLPVWWLAVLIWLVTIRYSRGLGAMALR